MGALLSTCTVEDNTEYGIWITIVPNVPTAIGGGKAKAMIHLDKNCLDFSARIISSIMVGGDLSGGGAFVMAGNDGIKLTAVRETAGMQKKQLTWIELLKNLQTDSLAETLKTSKEEATEYQTTVKEFCVNTEFIEAGKKFTWCNTSSMHMCVYVINDKLLQINQRNCYTNPKPGGDWVYPITDYFNKLDHEKKSDDSDTVAMYVRRQ